MSRFLERRRRTLSFLFFRTVPGKLPRGSSVSDLRWWSGRHKVLSNVSFETKKKVRESVQFAFFFDSRICLLPWILLSFEFICWLKKKKKSSLTRDMSSSGHILGNKDRFRNDAILEFRAFFLFVRYTFRREIVSRDSFLLLDLRHQWLLSVDDDEGMNMQRSVIVIHESLIIIIVSLKWLSGNDCVLSS